MVHFKLTIDRGSHVLTFSHFPYLDNEARNAKLNRNSTNLRGKIYCALVAVMNNKIQKIYDTHFIFRLK